MKNATYTSVVFISLLMLFGCDVGVRERGNGNMTTEEIEVDDFEEVIVKGNFEINLKQGNSPTLLITADENLHQYISTEVNGDRLIIETTESIKSHDGLTLDITYTNLSVIESGGAATVTNTGVIEGDYLSVEMSGAGAVKLNVNLKVLKMTISGAGAVEMRGEVDEQNISMSGAGGYEGEELMSEHCTITISGVGSAEIYVTESLNAQVSGVGGISYKGDPKDVTTDVSGLGSIDREEESGKK